LAGAEIFHYIVRLGRCPHLAPCGMFLAYLRKPDLILALPSSWYGTPTQPTHALMPPWCNPMTFFGVNSLSSRCTRHSFWSLVSFDGCHFKAHLCCHNSKRLKTRSDVYFSPMFGHETCMTSRKFRACTEG